MYDTGNGNGNGNGTVFAVMLNVAANGNYRFGFLCPSVLYICYFLMFLCVCVKVLHTKYIR